jgi:hypothetical protein
MILRNLSIAAALSAAPLLAAPANAQSAVQAGAIVKDPQGGEVGTIASVEGDQVVLRTDRHQARIPASAINAGPNGLVINITRDALNARIDETLAQAQQAIIVGAVVHDSAGAVVGPIEAVDAQTVTIRIGERQIQIRKAAVGGGPNGLTIGTTLAELQAQLAAPPAPQPEAAH